MRYASLVLGLLLSIKVFGTDAPPDLTLDVTPVSRKVLTQCIAIIDEWTGQVHHGKSSIAGGPAWAAEYVSIRKEMVRLSGAGKVYHLTPEIETRFGLDRVCDGTNCDAVGGLYYPKDDVLFLALTRDTNSLCRSFLHESIHSYQYRWRFPLDYSMLLNISMGKEGSDLHLSYDDIVDYLDFYYEAQAHYYVLSLRQDDAWTGSFIVSRAMCRSSMFVNDFLQHIPTLVVTGSSRLMRLAGVGISTPFYLPEGEELLFQITKEPSTRDMWDHIFSTRELVVQKEGFFENTKSVISCFHDFHRAVAQSLVKAYFGDLPFLLDADGNDQKIFVKLHNQYYRVDRLHGLGDQCPDLSKDLLQSGKSPLDYWTSVSPEVLQSCPAYRELDAYNIHTFSGLKSPTRNRFGSFKGGSEGSGPPDLKIHPNLHIKP